MKLKKLIKKINGMLSEEKLFLHYSLAFGEYKVRIKNKTGVKDLSKRGTKKEILFFLDGILQALVELKKEV